MKYVTTTYRYKGRGVLGGWHKRLHRADCRTLKPTTLTEPWTLGMHSNAHCGVCKPKPSKEV